MMLSSHNGSSQNNNQNPQQSQKQAPHSQQQYNRQLDYSLSTTGLFQNLDQSKHSPFKTVQNLGNKVVGVASRLPFTSLGLGSALSMNRDQIGGAKLPDHRSMVPSNALNAADLQFSGYILNGGLDHNRMSFSYSPAAGNPMLPTGSSSGGGSTHANRLLETLGMASAHQLSNSSFGSRTNASSSPTLGHSINSAGIISPPVSSVASSSYHHGISSVSSMPLSGYSSYASLLNKANLMFENNLDSMMIGWSLEERECRRRLVQFWRRHENNNIFCTFKSVAAADRVPNSIVVSCIYWEEKQDFFITSVDCIHLLESLIAVRFTVEEKNRIRRNLEGFRPLTVSKCKADSTDFFKLIMSFPNPKPRNIEKDVKVFPWRILPLALKKIIGKYTASYSSTASITLDAYPTSRVASYSQLAGISPSTSARSMAAFASQSPASSIIGSSSASAAIVAAASKLSNASSKPGVNSRSNVDGRFVFGGLAQSDLQQPIALSSVSSPSSTSLAAVIEAQRSLAMPRFDSSGALGESSTMAGQGQRGFMGSDYNVGAHFNSGLCGDISANNHTSATTTTSTSSGGCDQYNSEATLSISVPAGGSSILGDNPMVAFGVGDQRGGSRSAAASCVPTNVSAIDQFHQLYHGNQVQQQHQQSSSEYLLQQNFKGQYDFSGMAMNHPPLPTSNGMCAPLQGNLPSMHTPSSFFDQLAASYALSTADYNMEQQQLQNSQQQQQQQRVVRSSSTKKTAPRAPYNVDKSERRRAGSNGVGSECDVDCQNGFGSGQSERETSPSIPLMFEQQCQNISFDVEAASSALSASMLLSGPTMGNHTNAFMPMYSAFDKAFSNTTKNSSNSSNISSSGDTVFKSASPDANRADTVVSCTPAQMETGADSDMFKFAIGEGFDSNDFNFLAELISVSGSQGGGVIESCNFNSSVGSGGNMSYIPESMVDTGKCPNMLTLANSDTDIRQNAMQPSATNHLDHTPSPTKTHTDSETQFRSGTKVSAASAGGAASAHGLASPLAFGAALFGESKAPYLLDGSNGFKHAHL